MDPCAEADAPRTVANRISRSTGCVVTRTGCATTRPDRRRAPRPPRADSDARASRRSHRLRGASLGARTRLCDQDPRRREVRRKTHSRRRVAQRCRQPTLRDCGHALNRVRQNPVPQSDVDFRRIEAAPNAHPALRGPPSVEARAAEGAMPGRSVTEAATKSRRESRVATGAGVFPLPVKPGPPTRSRLRAFPRPRRARRRRGSRARRRCRAQ